MARLKNKNQGHLTFFHGRQLAVDGSNNRRWTLDDLDSLGTYVLLHPVAYISVKKTQNPHKTFTYSEVVKISNG